MKTLLYVDVPFAGIPGGDTNRSQFIWHVLSTSYTADLCIVSGKRTKKGDSPAGYQNMLELSARQSSGRQPEAVHGFTSKEIRRFREFLSGKKYDIIFFRFASMANLAETAEEVSPDSHIVFDVDMLFSRIAALSWKEKPTVRNRYYYLQLRKLRKFEQAFFNREWTYLFTNALERDRIFNTYHIRQHPDNFKVLPNVMQTPPPQEKPTAANQPVLFFGTLNSAANRDAVHWLMQEIYPQIISDLKGRDIILKIVGKNPTEDLKVYEDFDQVDLAGPVDDMAAEIRNARFVVLPLRVASGTRTRILEAGALGKGVITTPVGKEGLALDESEIEIQNDALSISNSIIKWINEPDKPDASGLRLKKRCDELYSENKVGIQLREAAESEVLPPKFRIAVVTNRFFPEIGGAEINIHYQVTELAAKHDVSVFCPYRIKRPRTEKVNGYMLYRLWNIFNPLNKVPDKKSRTFLPGLFFKLMQGQFDVIQCFPSVNYNTQAAVLAGQLSHTPVILCSFDHLDYAGIIAETGKIDPYILSKYEPKRRETFFLRRFSHIYAIANREIDFFKQFNKSVSYSPVPVLEKEFSSKTNSPKSKYGISESDFVFLSLGRVSRIKGQDIGLQAFLRVFHKMPGSRMVIVGRNDYEPELLGSMQASVRDAGAQNRVFFTGMVERDEVLGWLQHADIHVIPVRFMNSGAVVVESWISDTPVLQSDVVDPNLVEDGKNGYLFPSESTEACSEKMLLAYAEKDRLHEMAAEGKKLVLEKLTYKSLIRSYEETYKRVTKERF